MTTLLSNSVSERYCFDIRFQANGFELPRKHWQILNWLRDGDYSVTNAMSDLQNAGVSPARAAMMILESLRIRP